MAMQFQDYYETLGVARGASQKEIRDAYRKLARKYHPDLHTGREKAACEEKFKRINEAYEVLGDAEKRQKYDQLGASWRAGQEFTPPPGWGPGRGVFFDLGGDPRGAGSGQFSDFFEALFGGFAGGVRPGSRRRGQARAGSGVEAELELSLEDVHRGGRRRIQLPLEQACIVCQGTGAVERTSCRSCGGTGRETRLRSIDVQIPAGVRAGQRIRLAGQGESGSGGGPPGDLYLAVRVRPHPLYRVRGSDLEVEVPVMVWDGALGGQVRVPSLDGPVVMNLPRGSGSGQRLRLKGKGLRRPDGGRGDQYVRITLHLPATLDERSLSLLRELKRRWEETGGGEES